LKATQIAVLCSIPWQRLQFHLHFNAGAHVSRQVMRREAAEDLRTIFTAPARHTSEAYWKKRSRNMLNHFQLCLIGSRRTSRRD
jgi:putative transposase